MSKITKTIKKNKRLKKVKRRKLTEEEKEKRSHIAQVRSIFSKSGFSRVEKFSDVEIEFNGRTGDFDDAFVFQNVILLLEYTISQTSGISNHLLKKKIIFDHVINDTDSFLNYLHSNFSYFNSTFESYTNDEIKLFIIYCSKNEVSETHKEQVPDVVYLDYYVVKYFKSLTDIIKTSARYELFKFLNLNYTDIGDNISVASGSYTDYKGSLLPHSYSNFALGYKILSFYIDPKTLIERSYVLRKYGWLDDHGLYQRMIGARKISQIRDYLNKEERVFINNIIVTLPSQTKLLDDNGDTIKFNTVKKTQPVQIQLPNEYNIIGLIDGQHRVFAYHEGGQYEEKISRLRIKQNLLVTGIVYPSNISESEKTKFEAKLFLEINSNQANAKSDLKQTIGLLLKPFNLESISRAVLESLNKNGALARLFEIHYFDKGKLKTTSIVSYGLSPLVKLAGTDSLYKLWSHSLKEKLLEKTDEQLLKDYIKFCHQQINLFLSAIKKQFERTDKWDINSKREPLKILNTTTINAFLICLRKLVENNKTGNFDFYNDNLQKFDSVSLLEYKSSQYGDLADLIYGKFLREENE